VKDSIVDEAAAVKEAAGVAQKVAGTVKDAIVDEAADVKNEIVLESVQALDRLRGFAAGISHTTPPAAALDEHHRDVVVGTMHQGHEAVVHTAAASSSTWSFEEGEGIVHSNPMQACGDEAWNSDQDKQMNLERAQTLGDFVFGEVSEHPQATAITSFEDLPLKSAQRIGRELLDSVEKARERLSQSFRDVSQSRSLAPGTMATDRSSSNSQGVGTSMVYGQHPPQQQQQPRWEVFSSAFVWPESSSSTIMESFEEGQWHDDEKPSSSTTTTSSFEGKWPDKSSAAVSVMMSGEGTLLVAPYESTEAQVESSNETKRLFEPSVAAGDDGTSKTGRLKAAWDSLQEKAKGLMFGRAGDESNKDEEGKKKMEIDYGATDKLRKAKL
jgi:hypothetical protein